MTPVRFDRLKKVLCLGAHSDDIEIGCGGTLLRLIQENPGLQVYWFVFSASGVRTREARESARAYLKGTQSPKIRIARFQESYLPSHWPAIKDTFEEVKRQFDPDLIFTHFRDDRHQDHRVLAELAWNTFRNHLVLEYEIPKYEGDLGTPNAFFPVSRDIGEQKVAALMRHFKSQGHRQWFTPDTFWALMRLRGIECASPSGFAEAFHGRKLVF